MNTMTRIREVLPPARWRKDTIEFIGLRGFDGLVQEYKGLAGIDIQCTLVS